MTKITPERMDKLIGILNTITLLKWHWYEVEGIPAIRCWCDIKTGNPSGAWRISFWTFVNVRARDTDAELEELAGILAQQATQKFVKVLHDYPAERFMRKKEVTP